MIGDKPMINQINVKPMINQINVKPMINQVNVKPIKKNNEAGKEVGKENKPGGQENKQRGQQRKQRDQKGRKFWFKKKREKLKTKVRKVRKVKKLNIKKQIPLKFQQLTLIFLLDLHYHIGEPYKIPYKSELNDKMFLNARHCIFNINPLTIHLRQAFA